MGNLQEESRRILKPDSFCLQFLGRFHIKSAVAGNSGHGHGREPHAERGTGAYPHRACEARLTVSPQVIAADHKPLAKWKTMARTHTR